MDPLSEKYSGITPYNYTFNNPLSYNDPTGMEGDDEWVYNIDTKKMQHKSNTGGDEVQIVHVTDNENTDYGTTSVSGEKIFVADNNENVFVSNNDEKVTNSGFLSKFFGFLSKMDNALSGSNGTKREFGVILRASAGNMGAVNEDALPKAEKILLDVDNFDGFVDAMKGMSRQLKAHKNGGLRIVPNKLGHKTRWDAAVSSYKNSGGGGMDYNINTPSSTQTTRCTTVLQSSYPSTHPIYGKRPDTSWNKRRYDIQTLNRLKQSSWYKFKRVK